MFFAHIFQFPLLQERGWGEVYCLYLSFNPLNIDGNI